MQRIQELMKTDSTVMKDDKKEHFENFDHF